MPVIQGGVGDRGGCDGRGGGGGVASRFRPALFSEPERMHTHTDADHRAKAAALKAATLKPKQPAPQKRPLSIKP